jgi:hypothetical protein
MAAEAGPGWKPLGWNGVRLNVPAHWEVSLLGALHLQLDNGSGPTLELKWRRLSRQFFPERHLKRLARQFRHTEGVEFREHAVPEEWRAALTSLTAKAFTWSDTHTRGEGVLLCCAICGTTTLLQFFYRLESPVSSVAARVLRSFRDHSDNGMTTWRLFGLHAKVPQDLRLEEHRFSPGHYELRFAKGRRKLRLSRWGPADVILRGRDLRRWFLATQEGGRAAIRFNPREAEYRGGVALERETQFASGALSGLRALFSRGDCYGRLRVWHGAEENQIMAVEMMGGPRWPDQALFEEICGHYEVVSERELPGEES